MNLYLDYFSNFAIFIGAVIGYLRFQRIHPAYHPFLYLLWTGSIVKILSLVVELSDYNSVIILNINNLVEALFATWLFHRWFLFDRNKSLYPSFQFTLFAIWLLDLVFISGFFEMNSWFRIVYSFVLILLSINMINRLLFRERIILVRSSAFLICSGFIIFYTLMALTEVFNVYGLQLSFAFRMMIKNMLLSANFLCNLIYVLAILCMPRRQAFSLQY